MLRISHSLIDIYNSGDYELLFNTYLGVEREPTEAMIRGKERDEKLTSYITKNGCLPSYMGARKLTKPQTQLKQEVVHGGYQFVWVPDLLDGSDLYEFKSGITDLSTYVARKQVQTYMFLQGLVGNHIKRGFLVRSEESHPEWILVLNNESLMNEMSDYLLEKAHCIEEVLESRLV